MASPCIFIRPRALVTVVAVAALLTAAADGDGSLVVNLLSDVRRAPMTSLSRYTFAGNVFEATGGKAEHWVVNFCASWHEPCQSIAPVFKDLAAKWEDALDGGLFVPGARFAEVDCATEKVLCNEQGIEDYPTVVHYRKQHKVASWTSFEGRLLEDMSSDGTKLDRWLHGELSLEGQLAKAAALSKARSKAKGKRTREHLGLDGEEEKENPLVLAGGLLLIFMFVVGNVMFLTRSESRSPADAAAVATQKLLETDAAAAVPEALYPVPESFLPEEWGQRRQTIEL